MRSNPRSQQKKKELAQKIYDCKGKTKLRYAHSSTDYIVVEPEFFQSSGVFGNKNQRQKIIKQLAAEAQHFFQLVNAEQEFAQQCSSTQMNSLVYRQEFFDSDQVDQFLAQESFNILKEIQT